MAVTAGTARPVEAALVALLGSTPAAEPDLAEMGAVNAWRSIGPLILWRRGEMLMRERVDQAIAARPDLSECTHPVAVELAAATPRACWIGVTVSEPPGRHHHVNHDVLYDVLARGTASR
jgi:hypothetical protein